MKNKKKIIAIGLIICMMLSLLPTMSVTADSIVYVTPKGGKYHTTTSCSGLNNAKSVSPISLSKAISKGYVACSKCAGGTPGGTSGGGNSSGGSSTPTPAPTPTPTPTPAPTIPTADTIMTNDSQVKMYRMYNSNSGEHFYTSNAAEGNVLLAAGWSYEGVAWEAPATSDYPVYRVCNPFSGEHHYTMNVGERNALVSAGWRDENIGWYSTGENGVPLYRLYNPSATGQYA